MELAQGWLCCVVLMERAQDLYCPLRVGLKVHGLAMAHTHTHTHTP